MRNACEKKRTNVKGQGQGHRKHEISIRSVAVPMTHGVAFFASHDVNSEPIDFKIGTHIDFTCAIYHIKNCTNKNNITRITMATKYPIIKHRAFYKTLIAAYHPFILDGFL